MVEDANQIIQKYFKSMPFYSFGSSIGLKIIGTLADRWGKESFHSENLQLATKESILHDFLADVFENYSRVDPEDGQMVLPFFKAQSKLRKKMEKLIFELDRLAEVGKGDAETMKSEISQADSDPRRAQQIAQPSSESQSAVSMGLSPSHIARYPRGDFVDVDTVVYAYSAVALIGCKDG